MFGQDLHHLPHRPEKLEEFLHHLTLVLLHPYPSLGIPSSGPQVCYYPEDVDVTVCIEMLTVVKLLPVLKGVDFLALNLPSCLNYFLSF